MPSPPEPRRLHGAARRDDAAELRRLIAQGADVGTRDEKGSTPLFHARSPEVVRILLEAGADPRVENDEGHDALQAMLEDVRDPGRLECARLLLDAGVDIARRFKNAETRLSRAAFIWAERSVAFLLESGADPNVGDPLCGVCWWGEGDAKRNACCKRIIDLLVAAGASMDNTEGDGWTPMHVAAHGDWPNLTAIRALLAHGAGVDPVNRDGETPLMLAAERGEVACIRLLLHTGADPSLENNEGRTALNLATDHHEDWVEVERESKGDPDKARQAAEALAEAAEAVRILERALDQRPPATAS